MSEPAAVIDITRHLPTPTADDQDTDDICLGCRLGMLRDHLADALNTGEIFVGVDVLADALAHVDAALRAL